MALPDPERSRVVLVGSSRFTDPRLPDLPAVRSNISGLFSCFTDPALWGLPEEHCRVVPDPDSIVALIDPINKAAAEAEDTLLIYYAGHGLVHPRTLGLLLTTVGTISDRAYTATPYDEVRHSVVESPARRKVVILDCCYSGRATGGQADPDSALADEAAIQGTYLLTSSPPNKQSLSPPGHVYTTFTGALLETLGRGIRDEPEYLRLGAIYRHVRQALKRAGGPEPQLRVDNNASDLALVRNTSFTGQEQNRTPRRFTRTDSPDFVPSRLPSTVAIDASLSADRIGPLGSRLGAGGTAQVYELPGLELPDVPGPLAYKRYRTGLTASYAISKIVGLRAQLRDDPDRMARLDSIAAWPVRYVVDDHREVVGVVIPRVPRSFYHHSTSPRGTTTYSLTEVQFLFVDPVRLSRTGMKPPTLSERLAICRDFAGALAFLHDEIRVVVGDINAKNIVFRLDEEPMTMLLDCDSLRPLGDVIGAPQLDAPDWDAPDDHDIPKASTDCYKLGLLVLRSLTPGKQASTSRSHERAGDVLDAHGLDMLTRALQGRAHERPTAREWHRYLDGVIAHRAQ